VNILIAMILGYVLDLLIGDPEFLPHPIRLIGWLISRGEKLMRSILPRNEIMAGLILTLGVTGATFAIALGLLAGARMISPALEFILQVLFCYQILATRSLNIESLRVHRPLASGDLEGARFALSRIVGRDTQNLDEQQITKATVETVAENTSDGVIAPLIFIAIGGAPLGFLYKAINTLDSMIGYKNDRYLYFGRFAARLDDVANWLPARLTGCLMILASSLSGLDMRNAQRIYRRDRNNHASPNSAKPESAAAGALNIQLAGDATYFGQLVKKPTIGDAKRAIEPADILKVNRLMLMTSILAVLLLGGLRLLGVQIL